MQTYRRLQLSLIAALSLLLIVLLTPGDNAVAAVRLLLAPGNPVLSPAANAHNVSRNAAVSITYDAPISATTVTTRTFAVHAMQSGPVLEDYSINGGEIGVQPARPFQPGELVQVIATTGTLGLNASAPLTPTVWQFRVETWGISGKFERGVELGQATAMGAAVGDLDGDRALDLVIVNSSYLTHEVWLNKGVGGLTLTQLITNTHARAVKLGDLNHDGHLDAFMAGGWDGETLWPGAVWFNDGTGTLVDSGQALGNGDSYDVALGDLNGDGALDAVVANYKSYTGNSTLNEVWLNDGTGFFYPGTPFEERLSAGIALGDLDGDGDLDAFVNNWGSKGDRVWLNDGSGFFTDSGQSLGNASGSEVALADLNADGYVDAAVANNGAGSRVWFNDGSGQFSAGPLLDTHNAGVAVGDFNGDTHLDIYLNGANDNTLWFNDGEGNFTDSGLRLISGQNYSAEAGDMNGDGTLDLIDPVRTDGKASIIWFNRAPFSVFLPVALYNAGGN